jgi:hypothetical protein
MHKLVIFTVLVFDLFLVLLIIFSVLYFLIVLLLFKHVYFHADGRDWWLRRGRG